VKICQFIITDGNLSAKLGFGTLVLSENKSLI